MRIGFQADTYESNPKYWDTALSEVELTMTLTIGGVEFDPYEEPIHLCNTDRGSQYIPLDVLETAVTT